jgi:opacity protein-like surface antigen
MKRIQLSLVALFATSSFVMAGGDIMPIVFEEEVIEVAAVPVEPVPEPVVAPIPVPVPVVVPIADVSGIYVGLGLVAANYDTNCGCAGDKSGTDKTAGLMARVGYDFNKYVGVEARGLKTNWKSDGSKIKHAGLFAKPMLPVGEDINAYGLLGLAKTTTQGALRRTDVSGLAFGAGLEYDLSGDSKKEAKYDREFDGMADQEKGLGLFVDYERLYYKSGSPDLDAVSVGITYDF